MAGILDLLGALGGGIGGVIGGPFAPQQQQYDPRQQQQYAPQQYQQPQYQQMATLPVATDPDRLGAAFQNFTSPGQRGIFGRIADAATGLTTGQRTDPVGLYQQAANQTYRALLDAGFPDAQARLGAIDPEYQKRLVAPPALQKTGTDPFTGQDTFAWSQPNQMKLTPAVPSGGVPGAPAPTSSDVSMQGFSNALKQGVSGPALYDYLPKGMAATVKSMIEGRAPPPSSFALRSPQIQAMIQAANAIDPNFDQTAWGVRNSTAKNYLGGGKQFQELQAIGTVAGHLDTLRQAADALDNTQFPRWNSLVNYLKQGSGDPSVDRFNTALQAVSNELSRAYRGGHVTEGDVREWQSNINAAKSPAQLKATIGTMNDLLASKRQRLEEGYAQSMGGDVPLPGEFRAQSDKAAKTFDKIAAWSQGATPGGQAIPSTLRSSTAPAGSMPAVIPEGATATNPKTGQKLLRQKGQWVPLT